MSKAIKDLSEINNVLSIQLANNFKDWLKKYFIPGYDLPQDGTEHHHPNYIDAWDEADKVRNILIEHFHHFEKKHWIWIYFHEREYIGFKTKLINGFTYELTAAIYQKIVGFQDGKIEHLESMVKEVERYRKIVSKIEKFIKNRDKEISIGIENMNHATMSASELQSCFYKLHSSKDEISSIKEILESK